MKYNPIGTVIIKAVKNRSVSRVEANELSFLTVQRTQRRFIKALRGVHTPAPGAHRRAGLSGRAQSPPQETGRGRQRRWMLYFKARLA